MKKLLTLALCICVLSYAWYRFSLRAIDTGSQDRIPITVAQGMSTTGIAELLEEEGVIRSSSAFLLYAKLHGLQGKLQAGKYIFEQNQPVPEVMSALQSGKAEEISITIPEGYTVLEIDALLAEAGLTKEGEVLECAQTCDFSSFEFLPDSTGLAERGGKIEGYLYPDTYFVNPQDFVTKFFLERLLTTFRNNILERYEGAIAESEYELQEIVTMASLIEKETRTDDERPVVAGILWKRYDEGLGLGVDATVRYMLTKPTEPITLEDLNNNNPYNTRKFRGLPPGPIANSGEESIAAALNPEESSYYYYLHGNDGKIHYAETNEEHNLNKYYFIRGGQ